ncbi:heavy metal translocating P-type ATPase [Chitinimonas sp. BJB300]|uniref:heavy metal translocating P-type ATPase n=1 Tax=Chitinimonas sp. BJB300 TaxID=1559339 RepID=UPI000C0F59D7|nr:heavy metal translocating P-type ATPase [Chitinimonas sp. BJB300]PHV11451.1 copper-translocating P-type ATPase [Chitinimonas sp. BJB300]TSJ87222.1 heavy metal translocating P-type ATPase [Chitinimonas sp. BJB300]
MSAESCFHCGETVAHADLNPPRYPILYRQQTHPSCCAGCQAVAQTIIQSGLASYYEQREKPADRATPLPDELLQQMQLYDAPELQASFVKVESGNVREAALILEGISCAACIWLNERQLLRLPSVLEASINYTTHRARVRWDNSRLQLSQILAAVAAIGYRAHPYDAELQDALHQRERRRAMTRLWVAGLSMMQVMMFAYPVYVSAPGDISANWLSLMQWGSLLLTLPVVLYACQTFHTGMWRDLKRGRVGMDTPVVLGVWAAFLASCYATFTGRGEVYFDSVSMFVFLLLGGRYLEGMARRKAGAAAESLVKLIPAFAHRVNAWPTDRTAKETPVSQLQLGDVLLVKPGESYPADAMVLEGQGQADEALLTGESRPVVKKVGDKLIGGAVNLDAPLVVQVSQLGQETRLAGIVRLLDRALAEKPALAQLADRIAAWFVAALLLVAAAGYLFWHWYDPVHALPIMVAVLVISCPCALSLATPAALTAATGRLARAGLLVTRGHALEALAGATDIVFDKTGTLTYGQPKLLAVLPFADQTPGELQALAALLEAASEHPIARALREGCVAADLNVNNYVNHPGGGVEAVVAGQVLRLGRPDFVTAFCRVPRPPQLEGWHAEDTVVCLASAGEWLAAFALGDQVKPDATAMLAELTGLRSHLLSGDAPGPVQAVAQQLGLGTWRAAALPADKLAYVQQLQAQGRRVIMLGDGINDAPVLAAADVSIAVGGGADAAQAAGDMVLVGNLTAFAEGLAVARQTRRIIRQNLVWALGYNLVALPLALVGWVTPWLASLGMASSSLLVVLNAVRLAGANKPGQKRGEPR